jgi:hypothetical protein
MRKGTLCYSATRHAIKEDTECRMLIKLWIPGTFHSQLSLMLESEEDLSMGPGMNHVRTPNRTMAHHQSVNCRRLSLSHVSGLKEVPR